MALRADQTGTKAAFPERAGEVVAPMERSDTALVQKFHRARKPSAGYRRNEQWAVIAHEHVGVFGEFVRAGSSIDSRRAA